MERIPREKAFENIIVRKIISTPGDSLRYRMALGKATLIALLAMAGAVSNCAVSSGTVLNGAVYAPGEFRLENKILRLTSRSGRDTENG